MRNEWLLKNSSRLSNICSTHWLATEPRASCQSVCSPLYLHHSNCVHIGGEKEPVGENFKHWILLPRILMILLYFFTSTPFPYVFSLHITNNWNCAYKLVDSPALALAWDTEEPRTAPPRETHRRALCAARQPWLTVFVCHRQLCYRFSCVRCFNTTPRFQWLGLTSPVPTTAACFYMICFAFRRQQRSPPSLFAVLLLKDIPVMYCDISKLIFLLFILKVTSFCFRYMTKLCIFLYSLYGCHFLILSVFSGAKSRVPVVWIRRGGLSSAPHATTQFCNVSSRWRAHSALFGTEKRLRARRGTLRTKAPPSEHLWRRCMSWRGRACRRGVAESDDNTARDVAGSRSEK